VPADLVLRNANAWTGPGLPRASAVAIHGDRFVAVGGDRELDGWVGPDTRVVDLHGRVVLPGLIDAHTHILEYGRRLSQVDVSPCTTLADALEAVRAFAARAGDRWILGGGWDANVWGIEPTARHLDAATRAPCALRSHDCHSVWANSAALRAAGVTRDTPDPPGGVIVRDEEGDPTGILRENAVQLIDRVVPPPGPSENELALDRALREASRFGLTGVHTFEGPEVLSAAQGLRGSGSLRIRVRCHLRRDSLDDALRLGLRSGLGDPWLRIGSLKLFADGALGTQTAWMLEPYPARAGYRGVATLGREECEREIARAARGGIACAVHAIGDAANRMALDAFAATADEWRPRGLRQRVEHAQCLSAADLPRFSALGVVASMQPIHAVSDYLIAEEHWGDRCRWAYAWRSLLSRGSVLAFGSDAPVESIDPLLGIHAAVTRQRRDGSPAGGWRPSERLNAEEAIVGYTAGPAFAGGEERELGRIAPRYLADLVVLAGDPWSDPAGWLNARVVATIVGGNLAHGSFDELAQ